MAKIWKKLHLNRVVVECKGFGIFLLSVMGLNVGYRFLT